MLQQPSHRSTFRMEEDDFSSSTSSPHHDPDETNRYINDMLLNTPQVEGNWRWNTTILSLAAFHSCGTLQRNYDVRTKRYLFHVLPSTKSNTIRVIYGFEARNILETDLPIPQNIDDQLVTSTADRSFSVYKLATFDYLEDLPNYMQVLSAKDTHPPSSYEIVDLCAKENVEWVVVKYQISDSDVIKVFTAQNHDNECKPTILNTQNSTCMAVHVATHTPIPWICCVFRDKFNKLMLNKFRMGDKEPHSKVLELSLNDDTRVTCVTTLGISGNEWYFLFGLSNGELYYSHQNNSNKQVFWLVRPKSTTLGSILSILQTKERLVILGSNKLIIAKTLDTTKLKLSVLNHKGSNKTTNLGEVFSFLMSERQDEQAQRICLNSNSTLLATITNSGILRIFKVDFEKDSYELVFNIALFHGEFRNCLSMSFAKQFAMGKNKSREYLVVCFEKGVVLVVEPMYTFSVVPSPVDLTPEDTQEL
ncbi:hypothetical protein C9374_000937 [Naegleria lovaniensis]|uniref:Uncharacterized protein n=1 Tax=Naegleria lovaniensis TaxID=51637 RepID=A0AA88GSI8_NAELO|nr:uncharacterized protein C9374_000937 [Naegleria lovaniensis]KAG2388087.1 hypothetical protein C9374_000937 [Naegleria lovaniensis]